MYMLILFVCIDLHSNNCIQSKLKFFILFLNSYLSKNIINTIDFFLLCEQYVPVKPAGHEQVNVVPLLMHVAPFRHGLLQQEFTKKFLIIQSNNKT